MRIMVIAQDIECLLMMFVGGVGQRMQFFGVTPRAAAGFGRTHTVYVKQIGKLICGPSAAMLSNLTMCSHPS
jgi:hypothetical protein